MRKKISVLIVAVMVFAFATGVLAGNIFKIIEAEVRTDFTVLVDGEKGDFKNVNGEKVYPVLHDGTTYLPLRAISEILGKDVYWYEKDKRIELWDKDKKDTTVTDADVIISSEKNKDKPEKDKSEEKIVEKDNYIGKEKALAIALEKAGLKEADVSKVKVELDKDNDIYVYEVEFKNGGKEYSADIKAEDGSIVDWEVDIDD